MKRGAHDDRTLAHRHGLTEPTQEVEVCPRRRELLRFVRGPIGVIVNTPNVVRHAIEHVGRVVKPRVADNSRALAAHCGAAIACDRHRPPKTKIGGGVRREQLGPGKHAIIPQKEYVGRTRDGIAPWRAHDRYTKVAAACLLAIRTLRGGEYAPH